MQGRSLPREYPNWKTLYHYVRQWRIQGGWQRSLDTLRAAVRQHAGRHKHPTAGILDSQRIKTAHVSGVHGYAGAKQVTGRKRHGLVNTLGLLLAVAVTSAAVSDSAGRALVLTRRRGCKKVRQVWVDQGYTAGAQVRTWNRWRISLTHVMRPAGQRGFVVLPRRWVVERSFAWLMQYRRLRSDYEVHLKQSEAMIQLAMIRVMLRRLAQ